MIRDETVPVAFPIAAARASRRRLSLEEEVVSLFDQLRVPVLRYLLSLGIAVPDAEEILQEVFFSLYLHLRQGKPRSNLHGWVFRVAHNLGLKRRAKNRRESDHTGTVPDLSEVRCHAIDGPEERFRTIERQQRLLAVVRALPDQDQCCLSMRAEGLRYREIAEALGISLGSVANSLAKAVVRLSRVYDD